MRAEIALSDLGESALDWLQAPGDAAEPAAQDAAELLHAAMAGLSPEDRQVLTLLELEGRSVNEICDLTGFSNAAVRVRAHRARAKLRKALTRMESAKHE